MNNHPPRLFLPGHPMFLLWHRAHPTAATAAEDSQGCVQGSRWFPQHCCLAHSWLVFCKIHAAGTIQIIPQSPSYSKTDTCSDHLKTPPCLSKKEAATELDLLLFSLWTESRPAEAWKGLPMEATKTKWLDDIYSTAVLWLLHIVDLITSVELLTKWPEAEPHPKIQARQQLMDILPQEPNAWKSFRQHFSTSPLLSHSTSI